MRIVFDVDGVVCNFHQAYCEWVYERCGYDHVPLERRGDWNWPFEEYPDGKALWTEFFQASTLHPALAKAPIITGASTAVAAIEEMPHHITFATYRPAHAYDVTAAWLRSKLGARFFDLVHTADKSAVFAEFYLDDHAETVQSLLDAGRNAYVFDQPWNRHLMLPRLRGWFEVAQAIGEGIAA